jgi:hypothetical protein
MIITVIIYVCYSYYTNIYGIIADNYGLKSSLLIALDRRVNFNFKYPVQKKTNMLVFFYRLNI